MRSGIATLWVLNILDAASTYYAVSVRKCADELNVGMAYALERGPLFFFLTKFLLVALATAALVVAEPHRPRTVRFILWSAVAIYVAVGCVHAHGFFMLRS